MNNLFNIKDNITVITGGTGVLGRAIAKYLAENGAKVIIRGRNEEVGKKIIDEACHLLFVGKSALEDIQR